MNTHAFMVDSNGNPLSTYEALESLRQMFENGNAEAKADAVFTAIELAGQEGIPTPQWALVYFTGKLDAWRGSRAHSLNAAFGLRTPTPQRAAKDREYIELAREIDRLREAGASWLDVMVSVGLDEKTCRKIHKFTRYLREQDILD